MKKRPPRRKPASRKPVHRRERQTVSFTPAKRRKIRQVQRQKRKEQLQRQIALAARIKFKARKKDRGNLVFVSTTGKRGAQNKGRKGFLIYVTSTGKKWLLRNAGRKKEIWKPRKLSDIEPPGTRTFKNKAKKFQAAKLVKVKQKKAVFKGGGSVESGGQWDFSDSVVSKIAKSIKKTIEAQASKRSFLISANVLVKKPDGSTMVYTFAVPIDKPDHISIRLGGIENFVRQKFYAFMARELQYDGYVTSGSANHVRRLVANKGLDKEDWTQGDGEKWRGNESETVVIQQIEWKIEQAK